MAFESLSDKFQRIIKKLKGQSRLSEANMDDMLKEVRVALLEADVNFKVVKEFIADVKEKAIGEKVFTTLNPSQMVIKIVHDELVELLGSNQSELTFRFNGPAVYMMVGLQGTGKTTSCGKLAYLLKNKMNKKVLLAACDTQRPAATEQLQVIGKQIDVPVFTTPGGTPLSIASAAKKKAVDEKYDVLIIDTAGRLQVDEALMTELDDITKAVSPDETLLLVDAMSGQDAVNVAKTFNERLKITGIIMSKLDGDARGGAALSIKHLTGIPIKFSGTGEKLDKLDIFYPDRMADRILGMGDIMTLVEKAQEQMDEKETKKTVNKMMEGRFDLNDMLEQMKQFNKMGNMALLKLIPGMPKISDEQKEAATKEMKTFESIINSMTYEERHTPEILKDSRKKRISKGSGTTSQDINRLIKKYEKSKEMMKAMGKYQKSGKMPPNMGGIGGFPGM